MLFSFLLLSLSVFFVQSVKWHQLDQYDFEQYVAEHNKNYDLNEYQQRKAIFDAKLIEIKKHNSDLSNTWKMGVNHMTDWSDSEFNKLLGGGISVNRRFLFIYNILQNL